MKLEGSCHCGAVRFAVESRTPYPFMRCYCSICRKTAGGGGYAINIMGDAGTLAVEGKDSLSVYRVRLAAEAGAGEQGLSPARRHFCRVCGSALWVADPGWPELVHPFASAIDTPLPSPPERVHIMLDSRAPWAEAPETGRDSHFPEYPDESIEDWHRRHGLYEET
ncbi:MAG: GFA family protein [Proteobacteria bacterium]|nr:GFA family protein [Pseudomonadota bacterium]